MKPEFIGDRRIGPLARVPLNDVNHVPILFIAGVVVGFAIDALLAVFGS